jgi:hypothetical protein
MRDFLYLLHDLLGFFRDSPKRSQIVKEKAEILKCERKNIRPLCPTRFTVKFRAIDAAKTQRVVHIETLKEIMEISKDKKIQATASGFLKRLHDFDYYFALSVAHSLFEITDRLSQQLQSSKISIGNSIELTKFALSEIAKYRSEEFFLKMWGQAKEMSDEVGVSSYVIFVLEYLLIFSNHVLTATQAEVSALKRVKRIPARFTNQGSSNLTDDNPELYYRRNYFEIFDYAQG